jgi:hypothetical protein
LYVGLLLFYSMLKNGQYTGRYWGYPNITAAEVHCLSFHGHASYLKGVLQNIKARWVFLQLRVSFRTSNNTTWYARSSKLNLHLHTDSFVSLWWYRIKANNKEICTSHCCHTLFHLYQNPHRTSGTETRLWYLLHSPPCGMYVFRYLLLTVLENYIMVPRAHSFLQMGLW